MNYCGRILVCVLAGVALNAAAVMSVSDINGGSYQNIARRNIFGLLPLMRSRIEVQAPIVARPKIRLVGITALLGRKTAFLMLTVAKPGGVSECLLLREGETQEEIEVQKISDARVRVINHGEEQTLDFDENQPPPPSPRLIDSTPVDQRSPMPMPPPERSSLTPEQQMLLIEAQRMKAKQDGDPVAKILPPTEFTSEISDGAP